ncbi:hypothetical protein HAHI6034_02770 [Hathewaya histolytica]|uniref:Uncharacterized protein n=1 Tax=Hathewaya histolytica TaxID=1498 RepID=A0A4U9RF42_HATHI|nr:hypothetical protein [Hathewaya histolytica]VTQ90472.1 Uncharacterised protein [Hathewaya histolytica]
MSNKRKKEVPTNDFSHFNALLETEEESRNSISGYKFRDLEPARKNLKR